MSSQTFIDQLESDKVIERMTIQERVVWKPIHHHPSTFSTLIIRHCHFQDIFFLRGQLNSSQLLFEDCTFDQGIDFTESNNHGNLTFLRCNFHAVDNRVAINLNRVTISGQLHLDSCFCSGVLSAKQASIHGDVKIRGSFFKDHDTDAQHLMGLPEEQTHSLPNLSTHALLMSLPPRYNTLKTPENSSDQRIQQTSDTNSFSRWTLQKTLESLDSPAVSSADDSLTAFQHTLPNETALIDFSDTKIGGCFELTVSDNRLESEWPCMLLPTQRESYAKTWVLGSVICKGIQLEGDLRLAGLIITNNFNISHSNIVGSVLIGHDEVEVKESFSLNLFLSGDISFLYSRINGKVHITNLFAGKIELMYAEIFGDIQIKQSQTRFNVSLVSAKLNAYVYIADSNFGLSNPTNSFDHQSLPKHRTFHTLNAYKARIHSNFEIYRTHIFGNFSVGNSEIQGILILKELTTSRDFYLKGSEVFKIEMRQLNILENVNFSSIHVQTDVNIEGDNNTVNGMFLLVAAHIHSNLFIQGLTIGQTMDLSACVIADKLCFNPTTQFKAQAKDSQTDHVIDHQHEHAIDSKNLPSIRFQYVEIHGSLILNNANIGFIYAHGLTVVRRLDIIGGDFTRIQFFPGVELSLINEFNASRTDSLNQSSEAQYRISRYIKSKFGVINIASVHIKDHLEACHLEVGKDYDLKESILNKAGVHIYFSTFGGPLRLFAPNTYRTIWYYYRKSFIKNRLEIEKRQSPFSSRTHQQSSLWLYTVGDELIANMPDDDELETIIYGDIDLRGNQIGGSLDLRNIKTHLLPDARKGGNIVLEGTKVSRHVHLGGYTASDELDASLEKKRMNKRLHTTCQHIKLDQMQCSGNIELFGLKLYNPVAQNREVGATNIHPTQEVLSAVGLVCKGKLSFIQYWDQTQIASIENLYQAQIESGVLNLNSMDVHELRIGRQVFNTTQSYGHIDLEQSKISNLIVFINSTDVEQQRQKQTYSILGSLITEWTFKGARLWKHSKKMSNNNMVDDVTIEESTAQDFKKILNYTKHFEQNSWHMAEKYLRKIGRDDEADRLHVTKNQTTFKRKVL